MLVQGDPWLDELQVSDLGDPRPVMPSAPRWQSAVQMSFVYDGRDDPFNPTAAGIGSLSAELAVPFPGDTTFVRAEGAWTSYVTAGGYFGLVRARAGVGGVPGGGGSLPVEDRFRLGGGASFRGFALDSVGPANEVSQEAVDLPDGLAPLVSYADRFDSSRWVPTGGDAMGVATIEIEVPLPKLGLKSWTGTNIAFFTDFGDVWYVSPLVVVDSERIDPLLRWSVGVGLRRSTAIGPVAIDVGFNPQPLDYRGESIARVHVSLGAL